MKIEVLFGGMCLAFRKTMDFASLWTDPRGLTGSELGAVKIASELAALGHTVTLRTVSNDKEWNGVRIASIAEPIEQCDAVISINEPDLLRGAPKGAFRVNMTWLNDWSFAKARFHEHVDLFASCSEPHLQQHMNNPAWHRVEVTQEFPVGREQYAPDPAKWCVIPLGCDPERFTFPAMTRCPYGCYEGWGDEGHTQRCPQGCDEGWETIGAEPSKIPGRVVHCSSPDRGLHWLMQEWPIIKAAAPHATLHIFYRLEPWLRGFDQTPFFPPIEALRARALYVEECLRRFAERDMGVTLRDSVSRETIEREMAQAEVTAYPCNTTTWSEGFSCTLLEACAARACPITTDCDALGGVYGDVLPLTPILVGQDGQGEWVPAWSRNVIRALADAEWRESVNSKARAFAEGLTWKRTAGRIVEEILKRKS